MNPTIAQSVKRYTISFYKNAPAFAVVATLVAAPLASAQVTPEPAKSSEVVTLPTFTVSTEQDVGYRATNSVSATRIDTPIKDLPFTINAVTEQFITDTNAIDLQDMLRYAPGVTSGDKSFVAGNNRFSIRGFDGDVPPQRNGFAGNRNVDSANVSRVEIVKGPASLFYGQIIPGGTVNYITKRPEEKRFISIRQSIGNYSDFRTVVDANLPVDKQLGFRLVGSYDQAPEWAVTGATKSWLVAPSMKFNFNDKLSIIVDYERSHREETPPIGMMPNVQLAALNAAPTAAAFPNLSARSRQQGLFDAGAINLGFLGAIPIDRDFNYEADGDYKTADYENFNVELNAQFGDHWRARANYSWNARDVAYKVSGLAQWDVTPTAAYRTTTKSYFDYLTEYLADPVGVLNDPAKTTSVLLNRRKRIQTSADGFNTYQVDVSGKYEFNGMKLSPLFGAYRQYARTGGGYTLSSSSAYGSYSDTNNALPFAPWDYFNPSTWDRTKDYNEMALPVSAAGGFTRSLEDAYYGVLSATFWTDRVVAIVGARTDRYQSGGSSGFTYEAKKTTPQYGLGFHVTKDSLLFANYSKSFLVDGTTLTLENPDYNPTIPLNTTTNPQTIRAPAVPTTGEGYEVGLKTDFKEGRISSTLTAFHLERADRIVTVRSPVIGLSSTGVLSSTEVTFSKQGTVDQSEGLEFELTWSPLDNWQVYATYTTMDIKTTKVTAPAPRPATDPKVSGDYAAYLAGYDEAIALLKGAVPEGSAERLASLWTRYTFKEGRLKNLWVAGGASYTSPKAQRTANPALFLDAYTLLDAAAGYDWKWNRQSWNAQVNLKNITNAEYYPANQSRGRPFQVIGSVGVKF